MISERRFLCPRQLIDLDVSNFEYLSDFFHCAWLQKIITNNRYSTFDELPRTLLSFTFVFMRYFFQKIRQNYICNLVYMQNYWRSRKIKSDWL